MTHLNWQEAPQSSSTSVSSTGITRSIVGLMSNAVFSLALMGLIVGFGVGKWRAGSVAVAYNPPAQVIQAPLPQALPPPGGGGCGL